MKDDRHDVRLAPDEACEFIRKGICPPYATVTDDLKIWFDPEGEVVELPHGLTVEGGISLLECAGLLRIPDGIRATFLTVTACPRLESIGAVAPPNQRVRPDVIRLPHSLSINGNPRLRRLPARVKAGHKVRITDCPALVNGGAEASFPEWIESGHDTLIAHCPGIRRLPKVLKVGRELSLENLPNIERLDLSGAQRRVRKGLSLRNCAKLRESLQTEQFIAPSSLTIIKCPRLERVAGPPLPPGSGFQIHGCPNLAALPSNVPLPKPDGDWLVGEVPRPAPKRGPAPGNAP